MKLMLCVDDTDLSEMVARPLAALAHPDDEVHLFEVVVPMATDIGEPYSGSAREAEEAITSEFHEREPAVRSRLERLAKNFSARTRTTVVSDHDVDEAIIHYAEANDIDLIAMVTHSREQAFGEEHLGSIAERVTLSGVAPVLLQHRPMGEEILATDAFSPGTPVFTADGVELGQIEEVNATTFRVAKDGETRTLPRSAAASLSGGKMELRWDLARAVNPVARPR